MLLFYFLVVSERVVFVIIGILGVGIVWNCKYMFMNVLYEKV